MKLEIESVAFKNFLSFGSKVQEVEFLRGLNLVTGIDIDKKKSNGAGKSSFLETVPFALFGKVHRGIKKDQIINWKNRKNCEVVLNFRKGKNLYQILRAIKPNKLEIYCDGSLIDRPAHVKDYQNTLDEILQINFQTFMSVVHSNINSSAKILSMTKPEKRKFMETMFGLGLYTRLNEKCNLKLKTINDKIRELDINNQANRRMSNDISQRILDIHKQVKKLYLPQQEFKEAQETLKDLEGDFPNISEELESLKEQWKEVEKDVEYNKHLITLIKNRGQNFLAMKIKSIINSMNELEPKLHNAQDYERLVKRYGPQEQVTKEVEKLTKEAMKLTDEISDMTNKVSVLQENIKISNKDVKLLKKKISILSQDKCPECGQKIESQDMLIHYKQELEIIIKDIYNMNDKFDNLWEKIKKSKKTKEDLLNEASKLEKVKRMMFNKMEQSNGIKLDDYEKWKKDLVRYRKAKEKLDKTKREIIIQNGDNNGNSMKIHHKIDDLQFEVDKVLQLKNNMKQLEIKAEAVDSTIKQHHESIYQEEMKNKKLLTGMDVNDKKKTKLSNLKDYLEYIKFICKDENIKQEAISNIMPFMTKQTNFYLSEVDYGFYAILDRWLDAEIKGAGITNASYGSLSGGEGRGIDIALQLAFLDVAKVQAGVFPDFLTFDELLDSSIDTSGITELFRIVKTKQKDDDSKVFIISHRSELDNMDDVDNIYHVEKQNGYSKVAVRN